MLAVGSVVAGVGVVLVALLALLFRHPRAPRLARSEIAAMLFSVPVSGLIGFGLGYAATGVLRLLHGAGQPLELLAPVAVAAGVTLSILPVRRRLAAWAALAGGPTLVTSMPEIATPTDRPPRSPAPGARRRPSRKAA